ncbi:hypothetical protein HGM15179_000494 [Zosterops borbonicus]|uniref:Uncharacterized protein n=1 Tax=Zosterops borbonicus TaxID=364589 RepID=A0A8K1LV13_9PASS|nr:hypothetical protein HGM15179_000494 [Zosterops borbonicus]
MGSKLLDENKKPHSENQDFKGRSTRVVKGPEGKIYEEWLRSLGEKRREEKRREEKRREEKRREEKRREEKRREEKRREETREDFQISPVSPRTRMGQKYDPGFTSPMSKKELDRLTKEVYLQKPLSRLKEMNENLIKTITILEYFSQSIQNVSTSAICEAHAIDYPEIQIPKNILRLSWTLQLVENSRTKTIIEPWRYKGIMWGSEELHGLYQEVNDTHVDSGAALRDTSAPPDLEARTCLLMETT